jgi:hypothetical protein
LPQRSGSLESSFIASTLCYLSPTSIRGVERWSRGWRRCPKRLALIRLPFLCSIHSKCSWSSRRAGRDQLFQTSLVWWTWFDS